MHKPVDYPLEPNSSESNADATAPEVTYAVLRDRVDAKKPVTDEMIRTARTKMDTAHTHSEQSATVPTKLKLKKIRDRFRAG